VIVDFMIGADVQHKKTIFETRIDATILEILEM
jgi:hypothetical protein